MFYRWNPVYTILGLPDGSHFWPFSRLFNNNTERLQCAISAAVCAFFSYVNQNFLFITVILTLKFRLLLYYVVTAFLIFLNIIMCHYYSKAFGW